ncbi:MAG: ATP-binding cassette domain-containing protein [Coriobacteriales bacterium]|nr:ATP-binding cassette domain-containing protein [Coriobacteriales bacterium]
MSISVDIKKKFPEFTLEVAFDAGEETLGFLGASGCGKSLTLRCIAGLETPDEGRIVVNGKTFFSSGEHINLKARERKTALLFQNYMLFPNLTVADNIAAALPRSTSNAEKHAIVKEQLQRFHLEGYGRRYPSHLSGGQQQRIAIARMLVANPEILMLDEPFSALDSHLKGALEQDMLDLFDTFDGTILYVSHDIDEAFRFCDRIAVVDNGHIQQTDKTPLIVSAPRTLATLRISGVKNISPVRKVGTHTVKALAWGIELDCGREVPNDVSYMGVRASYLSFTEPTADKPQDGPHNITQGAATPCHCGNDFTFHVHRVSDSRFERVVMLDTPGDERIEWKVDMLMVPPDKLPVNGQEVKVHIPADKIYLV